MEVNLSTNQVLLILLALWSVCFWVAGWIANIKRKKRKKKRNGTICCKTTKW